MVDGLRVVCAEIAAMVPIASHTKRPFSEEAADRVPAQRVAL